jgi:predicted nucleic acid-binding protein
VDAYDADVLIYATTPEHPLRERILALFLRENPDDAVDFVGFGSVLLLPELLTKPMRRGDMDELHRLTELLGRLRLGWSREITAKRAVALGSKYGLQTVDSIHLATAIDMGADRFITNNSRDFPLSISEIQITYPSDLPSIAT